MKKEQKTTFNGQRTAEEIQQVRKERNANRDRLKGFDKVANTPDIQVTNTNELEAALFAVYSDEHGVFGLYGNGLSNEEQEPER